MVADGDWNKLKYGAQMLIKIHERLLVINEDGDVNRQLIRDLDYHGKLIANAMCVCVLRSSKACSRIAIR